ncbi:MAG: c-type cytochrome [Candidatus Solibacter usitatus]|nr:c-type cytochrome [Candidatus Solibacter usitatus]
MLSIVLLAAGALFAQPPVEYRIQRAASPITIDANLDEAAWQQASPVSAFIYNWFTAGEKEMTTAKLLWDDENLYVAFRSFDRHISAYERKRHGPVSKDDCLEIFISPNPQKVRNYYTFEINAIGTMLNRNKSDWYTGGATWEPEGVRYRSTFHGMASKDESANDREWILEMAIPLRNFAKDAVNMPPRAGDEWRLNLMRTGGKTNAQQSTWSPIPAAVHSFHSPEYFGKVIFDGGGARRTTGRGRRGFSPAVNAQDAEEGRALYNRSCTICHGPDGAAGDRAPALGAQRRYLRRTEDDLFDAIRNGIKGTLMPASPSSDLEIRKMVAFVRGLRAVAIDVNVAGDVGQGESIFFGKGNCSQCHMIRGRGGLLGPDLTNIGAERKLDHLRAALTQPKEVVPSGYKSVTVTTTGGETIRGVARNQNNFSIQVLGVDNKLHLLLRNEIRNLKVEEQSMMPAEIDKSLGKEGFANLLAFLSRQARASEASR